MMQGTIFVKNFTLNLLNATYKPSILTRLLLGAKIKLLVT